MSSVSQDVIALVRRAIGRADLDVRVSDQSVSKALKISRPVLIDCKRGFRPLPYTAFARAMTLLQYDADTASELEARLQVDLATDAEVKAYAEKALQWIRDRAKAFPGKVAGIVAVLVLVLNLAPTRVHASNATYVVDQAIPYAKWRRRRFTAVKPVLA